MATTPEQLLDDAIVVITKLQAWLDEREKRGIYYLNGDVAWVDEAEVLAGIPEAEREIYQVVNIAGVEYWFTGSPLALSQKYSDMSIPDGSIALAKLVNIATASFLGRNTSGTGVPEVLSVATVKTLLGLTGTNSGDQDLSGKVDKATGYSLVADTEIAKIHESGSDNQNAEEVSITDTDELFDATNVEDALTEVKTIADENKEALVGLTPPYTIILPAASSVAGRIVTPTELPSGWSLAVGTSALDLRITHGLTDKKPIDVKVWAEVTTGVERLRIAGLAYTGLWTPTTSTIEIESLAAIEVPIRIDIFFK
jgi:hypothetical protein